MDLPATHIVSDHMTSILGLLGRATSLSDSLDCSDNLLILWFSIDLEWILVGGFGLVYFQL